MDEEIPYEIDLESGLLIDQYGLFYTSYEELEQFHIASAEHDDEFILYIRDDVFKIESNVVEKLESITQKINVDVGDVKNIKDMSVKDEYNFSICLSLPENSPISDFDVENDLNHFQDFEIEFFIDGMIELNTEAYPELEPVSKAVLRIDYCELDSFRTYTTTNNELDEENDITVRYSYELYHFDTLETFHYYDYVNEQMEGESEHVFKCTVNSIIDFVTSSACFTPDYESIEINYNQ